VMKLKKLPPAKHSLRELLAKGRIRPIAMKQRYLDDIAKKIDLDLIRRSGLRILYGRHVRRRTGGPRRNPPGVRQIHGTYNPSFGGTNRNLSRRIFRT